MLFLIDIGLYRLKKFSNILPQTMSYNIPNSNKVENGDELSFDLLSPWFVSGFVDAEVVLLL